MRRLWRGDDSTPPLDLSITALARTTEQIIHEESSIPMVRALSKHNTHTGPPKKEKDSIQDAPAKHEYIDIQCTLCKSYGHKAIRCNHMAQNLLLQTSSDTLSNKMKAKILENYKKVIQDKRARRVCRVYRTVRQLYTIGNVQEADDIWDSCLFTAPMEAHTTGSDDYSTTSSEE
jgi:hypothetical protein